MIELLLEFMGHLALVRPHGSETTPKAYVLFVGPGPDHRDHGHTPRLLVPYDNVVSYSLMKGGAAPLPTLWTPDGEFMSVVDLTGAQVRVVQAAAGVAAGVNSPPPPPLDFNDGGYGPSGPTAPRFTNFNGADWKFLYWLLDLRRLFPHSLVRQALLTDWNDDVKKGITGRLVLDGGEVDSARTTWKAVRKVVWSKGESFKQVLTDSFSVSYVWPEASLAFEIDNLDDAARSTKLVVRARRGGRKIPVVLANLPPALPNEGGRTISIAHFESFCPLLDPEPTDCVAPTAGEGRFEVPVVRTGDEEFMSVRPTFCPAAMGRY